MSRIGDAEIFAFRNARTQSGVVLYDLGVKPAAQSPLDERRVRRSPGILVDVHRDPSSDK